MTNLSVMDIFKFLPAAKKSDNANCGECGLKSCMMFAVKLSKAETDIELCPCVSDELREKFSYSKKSQQLEITLNGSLKNLIVGGEKVMYRHEKTFINPPPLLVMLNYKDSDFEDNLKRLSNYRVENIGEEFLIEGVCLKEYSKDAEQKIKDFGLNFINIDELDKLSEIKETSFPETISKLVSTRKKAVLDRDENYIKPVYIHLQDSEIKTLCAKASAYICKYASLLIFDTFDEALFTTLFILRQNIFTDPEMPLQVESKVYEFNNPDENSYVFLTTNFALSYFAVANEISNLDKGAYLVITPSEGMSVLTAWSAEKITAEIAAKIINSSDVLKNIKNKRLIIPGLLADLKEELQVALKDWEIVVGTIEAYKIPDFIKQFEN